MIRANKNAVVLTFPVYIIGTQFAASIPRWSHRTPTEFIFSLLFALGIVFLMQYKRKAFSVRYGSKRWLSVY